MTYAFFYVFMTLGAFGVVIAWASGEQPWTAIGAWPHNGP